RDSPGVPDVIGGVRTLLVLEPDAGIGPLGNAGTGSGGKEHAPVTRPSFDRPALPSTLNVALPDPMAQGRRSFTTIEEAGSWRSATSRWRRWAPWRLPDVPTRRPPGRTWWGGPPCPDPSSRRNPGGRSRR